ncbi:hypothetical protein CBR_g19957 [Chara braunii]|uniref:Uncharacterized protein n=1 Tax=Chara braunii TaxID=69332 RepID=A0A388KZ35_CHABU|nr:hypothetical protein CBR_g19957 [Chara braunii]|eukprot:GBG75324.1 hypothetical protein CBR_g19957 [Chara braunii]
MERFSDDDTWLGRWDGEWWISVLEWRASSPAIVSGDRYGDVMKFHACVHKLSLFGSMCLLDKSMCCAVYENGDGGDMCDWLWLWASLHHSPIRQHFEWIRTEELSRCIEDVGGW